MWTKQYKDEPDREQLVGSNAVRDGTEGRGYYKEGTVTAIEQARQPATISSPYAIFKFDGNM